MAREDHLNAALDIHLEWGPERATPLQQHLRARLPAQPDEDFVWLERECDAVLGAACRLADEIGAGTVPPGGASSRLKASWPTLDTERIGRVMHQAYYSFGRDHGCSPEEAAAKLRRRK
jgi:hypothetical protein